MSSITLPLRPLTPPLRSSPEHSRTRRILHERTARPLDFSSSPLSSEKLIPTHKRKIPGDETCRGRSRTRSVASDTSSAKRSRDRHRRSQSPSRGTARRHSSDEGDDEAVGTPRKKRRTHQGQTYETAVEAFLPGVESRSRSRDRSRLRMKYRRASEKASIEVAGLRREELREGLYGGVGGEHVIDDDGGDSHVLAADEGAENLSRGRGQRVKWGEGMRNREEVAGLTGKTWLRRGSTDGSG